MYGETRDRGFGPEVKRRILLGTFVLSSGYYDAYYLRAQKVRTLIRRDFEQAFRGCDVVATPDDADARLPLGEKTDDPLQMYLADIFTVPANLAGIPGLSLPLRARRGLPVGLQLLGRPFDEATLLRAGHARAGSAPTRPPSAAAGPTPLRWAREPGRLRRRAPLEERGAARSSRRARTPRPSIVFPTTNGHRYGRSVATAPRGTPQPVRSQSMASRPSVETPRSRQPRLVPARYIGAIVQGLLR